MKKKRKPLGQILLDMGVISEEQIQKALEVQRLEGGYLGEVIVNLGLLDEDTIAKALGMEWSMPFVNLRDHVIDENLVRSIPEAIARKNSSIPIGLDEDDSVIVATSNPLNFYALDQVKSLMKKPVKWCISPRGQIVDILEKVYGVERSLREASEDMVSVDSRVAVEAESEGASVRDLKEMAEEAPIIKLANIIMSQALRDRASDIHVEPQRDQVIIRYRIDGVLHEAMKVPKNVQAALISRFKIIANMDIAERRLPQDGRINIRFSGRDIDLRVSTLPKMYGEKIVLRILDKSKALISLTQLGFNSDNQETFYNMIKQPYGMILVTGPTGSGKTTTLYSVLNQLNSSEVNLVSVEDPIEYELKGINQVAVNYKVGLTFANILRSILRQDPDIIMVGEIRDKDTAEMAMQAALTGHLVLSTLHTNDSFGAPTRLIDMGIEPFLIASSLIGVTAQRLARLVCTNCSEGYTPPSDYLALFEKHLIELLGYKNPNFRKGKGCTKCRNTGYLGRTGVHEILRIDEDIRSLVIKNSSASQIKETAMRNGIKNMLQDALLKAVSGITTLEEAFRIISTVEV